MGVAISGVSSTSLGGEMLLLAMPHVVPGIVVVYGLVVVHGLLLCYAKGSLWA